MKAAFYKGRGNPVNWFIAKWDGGKYSHCELIVADGRSMSASFRDKGVRAKTIDYDPAKWDIIELPAHLETRVLAFFSKTEGKKYDLFGQIRFLVAPLTGDRNKYWCSEWVAAALGLQEPYRYGPNGLYATLCSLNSMEAN